MSTVLKLLYVHEVVLTLHPRTGSSAVRAANLRSVSSLLEMTCQRSAARFYVIQRPNTHTRLAGHAPRSVIRLRHAPCSVECEIRTHLILLGLRAVSPTVI